MDERAVVAEMEVAAEREAEVEEREMEAVEREAVGEVEEADLDLDIVEL